MYLLSYYLIHANEEYIFLQTFDTEEDFKYRDKDAEYIGQKYFNSKRRIK